MIDPAPKVEAAKASAAKPRMAPDVEPATASMHADVENAPAPVVESAFAEPAADHGPIGGSSTKPAASEAELKQSRNIISADVKMGVEALRATRSVSFEAHAAVIIGPVERNICEKYIPCYAERVFISYGEAKRHILVVGDNIFVYVDISDASPLYTIPLIDLVPQREDPDHPSFYSHTISPEANSGLPFDNRSKESLEIVFLNDKKGRIAFQFAFDKNETGDDIFEKFVAAILSSKAKSKVGKQIG